MDKEQKAIALKYEKDEDNAPKILTKGRGLLAEKIIEIAKKNEIPIHKDQVLTEILDNIEIDYEIPQFLFEIIAEIYAYTYKNILKTSDF